MKIISKKTCMYALIAAGALTFGALGFQSTAKSAAGYSADVYVAGMGGHFAKASVVVTPDAPAPIYLQALTKVDIGDNETHPVHDARSNGGFFLSDYHDQQVLHRCVPQI